MDPDYAPPLDTPRPGNKSENIGISEYRVGGARSTVKLKTVLT